MSGQSAFLPLEKDLVSRTNLTFLSRAQRRFDFPTLTSSFPGTCRLIFGPEPKGGVASRNERHERRFKSVLAPETASPREGLSP